MVMHKLQSLIHTDAIRPTLVKRLETGYADNQPKWPYWVKPRLYTGADWHRMDQWMVETFGHSDWSVEHARWVGSDRKYWFRDEADRTFFILRWS